MENSQHFMTFSQLSVETDKRKNFTEDQNKFVFVLVVNQKQITVPIVTLNYRLEKQIVTLLFISFYCLKNSLNLYLLIRFGKIFIFYSKSLEKIKKKMILCTNTINSQWMVNNKYLVDIYQWCTYLTTY